MSNNGLMSSAEIDALLRRLESLEDPEQDAIPSFENTDWRTLCGLAARTIKQLRAIINKREDDPMIPLYIEYEPGFPEEVAFGSQMQMNRLKKWLDQYFQFLLATPSDQVAYHRD